MPLKYDSTAGGQCQQENPVFLPLKIQSFSLSEVMSFVFHPCRFAGTFSVRRRPMLIRNKGQAQTQSATGIRKGELTMDDLKYNPSALLIVGMLIGVVCMLLGI